MAMASLLVSGVPLVALLALAALSQEPPAAVAVVRLLTMFTVQANAGLALVAWCIWRRRGVDHPAFPVAWNAAVVGGLLTGTVAAVWMRPTLSDGVSAFEVADVLLHVASPLIGVALWLSGSRLDPHAGGRTFLRWGLSLAWPATWVAWVLLLGSGSGWYPYRQLDPADTAALPRWQSLSGIAALVVCATALALLLDLKLRRTDRSRPESPPWPTTARPEHTRAAAR